MLLSECPKCGTRMQIVSATTTAKGLKTLSLACPQCATVGTEIRSDDPMRSRAAGWVNADLHPPK